MRSTFYVLLMSIVACQSPSVEVDVPKSLPKLVWSQPIGNDDQIYDIIGLVDINGDGIRDVVATSALDFEKGTATIIARSGSTGEIFWTARNMPIGNGCVVHNFVRQNESSIIIGNKILNAKNGIEEAEQLPIFRLDSLYSYLFDGPCNMVTDHNGDKILEVMGDQIDKSTQVFPPSTGGLPVGWTTTKDARSIRIIELRSETENTAIVGQIDTPPYTEIWRIPLENYSEVIYKSSKQYGTLIFTHNRDGSPVTVYQADTGKKIASYVIADYAGSQWYISILIFQIGDKEVVAIFGTDIGYGPDSKARHFFELGGDFRTISSSAFDMPTTVCKLSPFATCQNGIVGWGGGGNGFVHDFNLDGSLDLFISGTAYAGPDFSKSIWTMPSPIQPFDLEVDGTPEILLETWSPLSESLELQLYRFSSAQQANHLIFADNTNSFNTLCKQDTFLGACSQAYPIEMTGQTDDAAILGQWELMESDNHPALAPTGKYLHISVDDITFPAGFAGQPDINNQPTVAYIHDNKLENWYAGRSFLNSFVLSTYLDSIMQDIEPYSIRTYAYDATNPSLLYVKLAEFDPILQDYDYSLPTSMTADAIFCRVGASCP